MKRNTVVLLILTLITALALVACGGGGGSSTPAPPAKTSEGTLASPLAITLDTPHNGSVDTGESYYSITVTSGTAYSITLSNASDTVAMAVCKDVQRNDCAYVATDATVTASGTSLYIDVTGQFTSSGGTYTLSVTAATAPTTTNITGKTPYDGSVDTTYEYFDIATVPGTAYQIELTGLSDIALLSVYDDDKFSNEVCLDASSSDTLCKLIAEGTSLYIKVDGSYSAAGTGFTLDMTERPALSATDLTGLTPYSGSVDASYALFSNTSTAGTVYNITLTGITDNAMLVVYDDDDTFTGYVCVEASVATEDLTCTVTASGASMYIVVSAETAVDFTLDMTEGAKPAPGITVSKTKVTVSETPTTATFTVVPDTQPASGQEIVITVTSGDTNEATVNPVTLTFTNANWDQPQDVTVTGVDDGSTVDGDQTFDITLAIDAANTSANEYDAVSIPSVSCTNLDNDGAPAGDTFVFDSTTYTETASAYPDVFAYYYPDGLFSAAAVDIDGTEMFAVYFWSTTPGTFGNNGVDCGADYVVGADYYRDYSGGSCIIDVTGYGAVGEKITGTYSVEVCLDGTPCGSPTVFSGSFDITREADH